MPAPAPPRPRAPGVALTPASARPAPPILLAARLLDVGRIILRPHHEHLRTRVSQKRSDVSREWGVAALMLDCEPAVHPYRRFVVDCAEVQLKPLGSADLMGAEFAPVPGHRVKSRVVHA